MPDLITQKKPQDESGYAARKGRRLPFQTSERKALLLLVDGILVNTAIFIGLVIWMFRIGGVYSTEFIINHIYWFPLLSVLWLIAASLSSLYDPRVAAQPWRTTKALAQLAGFLLVSYVAIYFLSPPRSLPRLFVLYFVAISLALTGIWRSIYTVYLGSNPFHRRAVIVGSARDALNIAEVIRKYGNPNYQVVGWIDSNVPTHVESLDDFPVLGMTAELPQVVQSQAISEVIFTSFDHQDEMLIRSLIDCQEQGVQITPMSTIYEELTERVPLSMVADGWIAGLPLQHASTGVIFPLLKRILDITLAVIGLLGLGLILPFVALAIRLDSKGSIFYFQDRLGKGGRVFRAYKFRSMRADAEKDDEAVWAQKNDPRVTRVGRLLRVTHLDEFPQLFNVLKGDMSVVGPRPERPELAAQLEQVIPFYRVRHSVRPGMAGWALVKQGYSSSVEDAWVKLEYDFYYIKHQSIWVDIAILLRTFVDAATFRGR